MEDSCSGNTVLNNSGNSNNGEQTLLEVQNKHSDDNIVNTANNKDMSSNHNTDNTEDNNTQVAHILLELQNKPIDLDTAITTDTDNDNNTDNTIGEQSLLDQNSSAVLLQTQCRWEEGTRLVAQTMSQTRHNNNNTTRHNNKKATFDSNMFRLSRVWSSPNSTLVDQGQLTKQHQTFSIATGSRIELQAKAFGWFHSFVKADRRHGLRVVIETTPSSSSTGLAPTTTMSAGIVSVDQLVSIKRSLECAPWNIRGIPVVVFSKGQWQQVTVHMCPHQNTTKTTSVTEKVMIPPNPTTLNEQPHAKAVTTLPPSTTLTSTSSSSSNSGSSEGQRKRKRTTQTSKKSKPTKRGKKEKASSSSSSESCEGKRKRKKQATKKSKKKTKKEYLDSDGSSSSSGGDSARTRKKLKKLKKRKQELEIQNAILKERVAGRDQQEQQLVGLFQDQLQQQRVQGQQALQCLLYNKVVQQQTALTHGLSPTTSLPVVPSPSYPEFPPRFP